MIDGITNFVETRRRTTPKPSGARFVPDFPRSAEAEIQQQRTCFTKVFRWQAPAEQTPQPNTVEVVGSFSGWRKIPLRYEPPSRTWQVSLNDIESNRTHRYVILVDGKPTYDKTCDGLVAPQTPDEAKWGIETPRGLRVMLLFSQTK